MRDGLNKSTEEGNGTGLGAAEPEGEETAKRTRDLGTIRIYRKEAGPGLIETNKSGVFVMVEGPMLMPIDHPEFKATAEADKWLKNQEHLKDGKYAIQRDIVERTVGTVTMREVQ